jgi:hypothetical protein
MHRPLVYKYTNVHASPALFQESAMKIRYSAVGGRLVFESDVANPKEAFEWLSTVQELFEESVCGLCGQNHLSYEVREYDGNNYYKLFCRNCHAQLDFGQRRDGANLFIKRKDAEGNVLTNNGWYRWQGQASKAPVAAPAPQATTRREPSRAAAGNKKKATPAPF